MRYLASWSMRIGGLWLLLVGALIAYRRQEPSAAYLILWMGEQGDYYTALPDGQVQQHFPVGSQGRIRWINSQHETLYIQIDANIYSQRINTHERRFIAELPSSNLSLYNFRTDREGYLVLPLETKGVVHLYRVSPEGVQQDLTPGIAGIVPGSMLGWEQWVLFQACQGVEECQYYQLALDNNQVARLPPLPQANLTPCSYRDNLLLFCGGSLGEQSFYSYDLIHHEFLPTSITVAAQTWINIWHFDRDVIIYRKDQTQVVYHPLDGTPPQMLTYGEQLDYMRAAAGIVYYRTYLNHRLSVYKMETTTGNYRLLYTMEGVENTHIHSWLDDQTLLIGFTPLAAAHLELEQVDMTTGERQPFAHVPATGQGILARLPDPRWFRLGLSRIDATTGEQVFAMFLVSQDGQQVQPINPQAHRLSGLSGLIDLPVAALRTMAIGGALLVGGGIPLRKWVA